MKIAICDDDRKMWDNIEKLLKLAFVKNELDWMEPVRFSGGKSLLAQYEQGQRFDLIYLDIEMPELSGIETAARLRALDRQVQMIFITSHEQYVYDAIGVQPVDYLTKPIKCQRFQKAFDRALKNYRLQHQTIILEGNSGYKILPAQDIVYIESAGKKAAIHLYDGEIYAANYSLSELEQMLKSYSIIRCHRAYLVHLGYVREISAKQSLGTKLRASGQDVLIYQPTVPGSLLRLPIGRTYDADFEEAVMKYQQEGGWIRT